MSEPRLTSFAAGLTFAMPLSIQRPGIGLPESKADTTAAPVRFFCVRSMASLLWAGRVGVPSGTPVPVPGTPTLHGSPTLIGVRASGNYTATQELQP